MTRNGALLDDDGQLRVDAFVEVMREQVRRYVRQQLTNTLVIGRCVGAEAVQLSTMKAILHEQVSAAPEHCARYTAIYGNRLSSLPPSHRFPSPPLRHSAQRGRAYTTLRVGGESAAPNNARNPKASRRFFFGLCRLLPNLAAKALNSAASSPGGQTRMQTRQEEMDEELRAFMREMRQEVKPLSKYLFDCS